MRRDNIGNGVRHCWQGGNAKLAIWQGVVEAMNCWHYGKEMLGMRRYVVGNKSLGVVRDSGNEAIRCWH